MKIVKPYRLGIKTDNLVSITLIWFWILIWRTWNLPLKNLDKITGMKRVFLGNKIYFRVIHLDDFVFMFSVFMPKDQPSRWGETHSARRILYDSSCETCVSFVFSWLAEVGYYDSWPYLSRRRTLNGCFIHTIQPTKNISPKIIVVTLYTWTVSAVSLNLRIGAMIRFTSSNQIHVLWWIISPTICCIVILAYIRYDIMIV